MFFCININKILCKIITIIIKIILISGMKFLKMKMVICVIHQWDIQQSMNIMLTQIKSVQELAKC